MALDINLPNSPPVQPWQPSNPNLLQQTKFQFTLLSAPYLRYFCQNANLPGVNVGFAKQATPLSTVYRAGDKIEYAILVLEILLDEDLRVWESIYNWMRGYSFPENFQEYTDQKKKGIYCDATLLALKNSNLRNVNIKYINCFPIDLAGINFDTTTNADTIMTTKVTFRYDYFSFDR